jgi:hypothetical protein
VPIFEGCVLRVYRLPIVVEADDGEEARREIERIYRRMRDGYDGSQDVFCGDAELPASQWPVEEIQEDPPGSSRSSRSWKSWAM